jgi:hypothetical protein
LTKRLLPLLTVIGRSVLSRNVRQGSPASALNLTATFDMPNYLLADEFQNPEQVHLLLQILLLTITSMLSVWS